MSTAEYLAYKFSEKCLSTEKSMISTNNLRPNLTIIMVIICFLYYVAALSSEEMVFENNAYNDHTYRETSVEEQVGSVQWETWSRYYWFSYDERWGGGSCWNWIVNKWLPVHVNSGKAKRLWRLLYIQRTNSAKKQRPPRVWCLIGHIEPRPTMQMITVITHHCFAPQRNSQKPIANAYCCLPSVQVHVQNSFQNKD